jgi:hypothetical protein
MADFSQFVPGSGLDLSGGSATFLGVDTLAAPIRQRIVQWAQQQAVQRLGKETAK